MRYFPRLTTFNNDFMNPLFDDFFSDRYETRNVLKTDITENEHAYQLCMEVPGMKKEDIQLQLKDGYLTINATRNNSNEEKDEKGNIIRQERFTGSCSRSFYVGENVHQEDVKARFENGELFIEIPKEINHPEPEQQFIQIQ